MRRVALAAPLFWACSLVTPLDGLGSDASTDTSPPEDVTPDVSKDAGDAGDAGSLYADKVMADAPLAYYRLDEPSGTVAHDSSGNHHDCNFVGAVSFGTAGALVNDGDTAATFDGNTGHVDCGQLFDFAGTSPFTVEMWLHPVLDGTYRGVFGKSTFDVDAGTSSAGVHGYISSAQPDAGDNHLTFERLLSTQTRDSAYALGIPTTTWMHMVSIYDGSNVRLYVDAALGGSTPSAASIASTTAPFVFAGADAYTPFNGAIDEVAIYASALPPNRILAHYNAGIGL